VTTASAGGTTITRRRARVALINVTPSARDTPLDCRCAYECIQPLAYLTERNGTAELLAHRRAELRCRPGASRVSESV
jgi:hypothetical protein